MEIRATLTALTRAAKAYRHASRQLEAATSERARKRHARRALNAARHQSEARRFYEMMALETAD